MDQVGRFVADAVLGIDTLWGGDVMCPSGTGRFIADSWFSDEPLPAAYTLLRRRGARDRRSCRQDHRSRGRRSIFARGESARCHCRSSPRGRAVGGLRGQYLVGLANCLEIMWDLAMEILGKGPAVPYARCVEASTGRPPEPSKPEAKRDRVAELLNRAGYSDHRQRRSAGRGRRVAARARHAHGFGPRAGRMLSSPTSTTSARRICCPIFPRNWRGCRAPTSTSCPSRTPGSPAR